MMKKSNIASIVRFHRKMSGLSQSQLATVAGVGKTVIYDIEKGKESVQIDTLRKVLHALNIVLKFGSPLMDEYHKQFGSGDEES